MSSGEQTGGDLIAPLTPKEGEKKPVVLTVEKKAAVPITRWGQTFNYDSYAIFHDGQLADADYWEKLPSSDLVRKVTQASSVIEQNPDIKAFSEGSLNADNAKGEEALGYQYLDILDAISHAAQSHRLSVDDVGEILDYVYDAEKIKPFMGGLTSEVFGAVLTFQRDVLYSALQKRGRSLANANAAIDKLPYGGIFLLDKEPTASELSKSFTQTEDEAEKNIVVDSSGRFFLVKGMDKNTGTITYRHFPDIVRDFHTHRTDHPFSTGDIGTYKSFGASRDIYGVVSNNVDFFVCSPSGIFQFSGDLAQNVFDKQDRKTDSLLIPCEVVNEDTGGSARFLAYSNHDRGESGQFIQKQIQSGASSLAINFDNGDTIHFASWEKLEKQGSSAQGIGGLTVAP